MVYYHPRLIMQNFSSHVSLLSQEISASVRVGDFLADQNFIGSDVQYFVTKQKTTQCDGVRLKKMAENVNVDATDCEEAESNEKENKKEIKCTMN